MIYVRRMTTRPSFGPHGRGPSLGRHGVASCIFACTIVLASWVGITGCIADSNQPGDASPGRAYAQTRDSNDPDDPTAGETPTTNPTPTDSAGAPDPPAGSSSPQKEDRPAAEPDSKQAKREATSKVQARHPFPDRRPAPSFGTGLEWLNTAKPLEIQQLRGKFVLLDFWTYCCINCMHILPELKKLEAAYPNELVVIGVHSAKFEAERDLQNIREAVLRYEIDHPVVNDSDHKIWNRYGVRSWPSLRVIDPEGNLVAGNSGEVQFETLDAFLKAHLDYYRQQGKLDERPFPLHREADQQRPTPLRFPGKVLADEKQERLYIADSNHNRIVITDLDGTLIEVLGTGGIGHEDGPYESCSWNHPQGMARVGESLYVADTENHLLRKVDLVRRQVTTIAGTGQQARSPWPGGEDHTRGPGGRVTSGLPDRWVGEPRKTGLNSPWALWIHEQDLYIAMAGPHQIWKMPLDEREIGPYAGNGREDIVDGPLLPRTPYQEGFASFAQPSGLTSDGKWLYVADSEGSSIRAIPFDPLQKVETVVGTAHLSAGRLFAFGDVDGKGHQVRLQHALGVVYHRDRLYVTDTYNNKIKVVDLVERTCSTLVGTGDPGHEDQPAQFDEPAGITAAADRLFVADTNNHTIRVIDLSQDAKVSTLSIQGLTPPGETERQRDGETER